MKDGHIIENTVQGAVFCIDIYSRAGDSESGTVVSRFDPEVISVAPRWCSLDAGISGLAQAMISTLGDNLEGR